MQIVYQAQIFTTKSTLQGEAEYISKVAKTEKEICSLVESGFEYVTEFEKR